MAKKPSSDGASGVSRPMFPEACREELADLGLSESEQTALLDALHRIVRHFVDLAFDGQKACGKLLETSTESGFKTRSLVKSFPSKTRETVKASDDGPDQKGDFS